MARVLVLGRRALGDASSALDALLAVYAQVLFARSRIVGALLLAATATSPRAMAYGVLAIATAAACARLLGLADGAVTSGPYGYNALLVGLGVARSFPAGATAAVLVVAAAAVTVLATASIASLFARIGSPPVLSLPFVLVFWLVLSLAPSHGAPHATMTHATPTYAAALPAPLAAALESIGALFFLPRADAGALVLAALVVQSRIATLLALVAGAVGALLVPAHASSAALNGALTAVAIGGVWFVPSASSFALALAGALVAIGSTAASSALLARAGLPALILPFNVAVVLVLFATRQRVYDRSPKSVDFVPGSPEENLAYFQTRLARFRALYAVTFRLPFRGAWTCTQGVDGAHTHQGDWRHGFDFEVRGDDGSLFKGSGASPEDHHCHKLPVLASADGVVVKVENDHPDNEVGGLDLRHNWGNVVVVHHATGLYSLVAHLARGSVRVHEGQAVRRGDVLGLCGSSGRSPRPHLHFQLQGSAQLGAATLPCRFSDAVVRDDGERLAHAMTPREGDTLRNIEPDEAIAQLFAIEPGATFALGTGDDVEHVEHAIDLLGNHVLTSRETGATLCFARTDDGFTSYDPLGAPRSALHLVRAALPRVPFDAAPGLVWTDYLPARWARRSFLGPLRDFVAPFVPRAGLAMEYRAVRDGDRLTIVGTSIKSKRGEPVVRTEATLSRARGLLAVEARVGRTSVRVERVDGAARAPTKKNRDLVHTTRRIVMSTAKWIGVAMLLVIGCSKSGIEAEPPVTSGVGPTPTAPPTEVAAPSAPTAQAGASTGEALAFQRSYDEEAAGKNDAALAALEGLRLSGNALYVAELRRGWLLYRLGKHGDAVTAYGRAIALEPLSVEAKVGVLAPLAASRRWADVEGTARDVLKRDVGNYSATLRLAFALYSQAKFGEAEGTYRALVAAYPSDVDARDGLGWSLLKLGRTRDAQAVFAEVLAVAPKNALALDGMAATKK